MAEGTVVHSPTETVHAAVEALYEQFFEPLIVADLFRDAWDGAAAALARADVSPVPPAPAYPSDPVAAFSTHAQTFPALERLAAGRLSPADLTAAALRELLGRRQDGHTFLLTPQMHRSFRSRSGSPKTFGLALTDTPPLTVSDVLPRGPGQRAGARRGHVVLTINGDGAADGFRPRRVAAERHWRDTGPSREAESGRRGGRPRPAA